LQRVWFRNCVVNWRVNTKSKSYKRVAKQPEGPQKIIKYSQLPLADRLLERLRNPLCYRKEPIQSASVSEDVLIPYLSDPKRLLPENEKSLEVVVHDNILHPRCHYSFLVPLVNYLFYRPTFNTQKEGAKTVIITPTKEFATILFEACVSLLPNKKDIEKVRNISNSKAAQLSQEFNNSYISICTPSELQHISQSSDHILDDMRLALIHYADIVLENKEDSLVISSVLSQMAPVHSTLMFAHSLTEPVVNFAKENLPQRSWVNLKPTPTDIEDIPAIQYSSVLVNEANRFECLMRLLNIHHQGKTLVYLNSVSLVEDLGVYLHSRGYKVEIFHSSLDARDQKKRFGSFVNGFSEILLCTDLLLRSNDIQGCSLCIQYRLPLKSLGTVLHRSWKMGSKGGKVLKTFLLYFEEDKVYLPTLESKYNVKLSDIPIPSTKENRKALTKRTAQTIKKTNSQLGIPFQNTAQKLIEELGDTEALSRALFLLSKIEDPDEFDILPKATKARIARKEKIMKVENYVANKKQKARELRQLHQQIAGESLLKD